MGEIADDIIMDIIDYEGCREKIPKTCRNCGESGLVWMKRKNRWVLGDGEKMHKCSAVPYQPLIKTRRNHGKAN